MQYHWGLAIGHTYSYSHEGTHPGTHPSHLDHNTPQAPRADSDVFELDVGPDVELPTFLEELENTENLELCLEIMRMTLMGNLTTVLMRKTIKIWMEKFWKQWRFLVWRTTLLRGHLND